MKLLGSLGLFIFVILIQSSFGRKPKEFHGLPGKPVKCDSITSVGMNDLYLISDVISGDSRAIRRFPKPTEKPELRHPAFAQSHPTYDPKYRFHHLHDDRPWVVADSLEDHIRRHHRRRQHRPSTSEEIDYLRSRRRSSSPFLHPSDTYERPHFWEDDLEGDTPHPRYPGNSPYQPRFENLDHMKHYEPELKQYYPSLKPSLDRLKVPEFAPRNNIPHLPEHHKNDPTTFHDHVRSNFPTESIPKEKSFPSSHQTLPIFEQPSGKLVEDAMVKDAAIQAAMKRAEKAQDKLDQQRKKNPGGVPQFVQHVLDNAKGKPGEKKVVHQPKQPKQPSPKTQEVAPQLHHGGAHDLLKNLDPQKLDQLRQILNSAAAGKPAEASSLEFAGRGFPGAPFQTHEGVPPQGLHRIKRSTYHKFPYDYLSEKVGTGKDGNEIFKKSPNTSPRQCVWRFKKAGKKCNKLVVRMKYWVDAVKDCKKEYLQISGTKRAEKFCGVNGSVRSLSFDGEAISIQHFRAPGLTNPPSKFKATVLCE